MSEGGVSGLPRPPVALRSISRNKSVAFPLFLVSSSGSPSVRRVKSEVTGVGVCTRPSERLSSRRVKGLRVGVGVVTRPFPRLLGFRPDPYSFIEIK